MQFRLRIQPSSPSYDDAPEIARFAKLNGTTFEAENYDEATIELRRLGLDANHGIGVQSSNSAYPDGGDRGVRVWHLTGAKSRRRLGNNCKLQQLRAVRRAA